MCSRMSLVPVTAPRTLVIRFQRTKKALVTVHATSRSQLNYHLYTMFDTLCSGLWLHLQLYHHCSYLLLLQLPTYLPNAFHVCYELCMEYFIVTFYSWRTLNFIHALMSTQKWWPLLYLQYTVWPTDWGGGWWGCEWGKGEKTITCPA